MTKDYMQFSFPPNSMRATSSFAYLKTRWTSARDTFTPSPLASSIMASGVNMGMSSMRVKACAAKTFSRSV